MAIKEVLLRGSGWSRQVGPEDASMLVERLRVNDYWTLAFKFSEKLDRGGELVLTKEEKDGLFSILEGMRVADDPKFSQRLNLLANDLDDDIWSYGG